MNFNRGAVRLQEKEIIQSRLSFWMLILIVIVHVLFAAISFSGLPDKIPVHFNAAGQADRFSETGIGSWFLLWFMSAGMAGLIAWIAQIMHRIPMDYINIPRKEEFLTLPEESRIRVFLCIKNHLMYFGCLMSSFFFALHIFINLAATGKSDGLPPVVLWGGTLAIVVYGFALWFISNSAIKKELEIHRHSSTR